jgi:hypothetical protein
MGEHQKGPDKYAAMETHSIRGLVWRHNQQWDFSNYTQGRSRAMLYRTDIQEQITDAEILEH